MGHDFWSYEQTLESNRNCTVYNVHSDVMQFKYYDTDSKFLKILNCFPPSNIENEGICRAATKGANRNSVHPDVMQFKYPETGPY